jgi:hypothetical protein
MRYLYKLVCAFIEGFYRGMSSDNILEKKDNGSIWYASNLNQNELQAIFCITGQVRHRPIQKVNN